MNEEISLGFPEICVLHLHIVLFSAGTYRLLVTSRGVEFSVQLGTDPEVV